MHACSYPGNQWFALDQATGQAQYISGQCLFTVGFRESQSAYIGLETLDEQQGVTPGRGGGGGPVVGPGAGGGPAIPGAQPSQKRRPTTVTFLHVLLNHHSYIT